MLELVESTAVRGGYNPVTVRAADGPATGTLSSSIIEEPVTASAMDIGNERARASECC